MTADAWRICPNCIKQGKLTVTDPDEIVNWEYDGDHNLLPKTLREDYEIYLKTNGILVIDYSCSCHVCKFSYNHQENKKVI